MNQLLKFEDFLLKYNISNEKYAETGLLWEDLEKIYSDYIVYREELEPIAQYMFNTLMKSSNVHSVRYRIKNPEHLIEKIIRKKMLFPKVEITLDNYKQEINDLIGLRALHLFKADWESIHDFIQKTWNLKGDPIANYRKGDSDDAIEFFKKKGCEIKEHKYGYRSIHYIIASSPGINTYYAEIQVRTIFEEAWAEIDHTIRYPYDLENQIFFQYLLILNRLAGSADEMGSFIQFLKNELIQIDTDHRTQLEEKEQIINGLEIQIEKLNITKGQMGKLKEELRKLKDQKSGFEVFQPSNSSSLIKFFNSNNEDIKLKSRIRFNLDYDDDSKS